MDIKNTSRTDRPVKDVLAANTYIFVLKVHNIICVVFWGLEGEEPRHHLALSTPPLPSCPCRPINKFCFKESQTKGL